jgi:hypothetical protein
VSAGGTLFFFGSTAAAPLGGTLFFFDSDGPAAAALATDFLPSFAEAASEALFLTPVAGAAALDDAAPEPAEGAEAGAVFAAPEEDFGRPFCS